MKIQRERACKKCGSHLWNARPDGTFTCAPCTTAAQSRYHRRNKEKCRQARAKWRAGSKQHRYEYRQKYYAKNRDRILAHAVKYAAENREKVRESQRKSKAVNRAGGREYERKYGAANREKMRAKARAYYARNYVVRPEQWYAAKARRRARRLAAPGGGITSAQRRELLASTDGLCTYCGERKRLTLDHVVPLTRGGADHVSNLVPACVSCNCRKQTKLLSVWLAEITVAKSLKIRYL